MDLKIGDIVTLKKQHPCGANNWKIVRVGADFKLTCCGCGHLVMIPRVKLEKSIRKVISAESDNN